MCLSVFWVIFIFDKLFRCHLERPSDCHIKTHRATKQNKKKTDKERREWLTGAYLDPISVSSADIYIWIRCLLLFFLNFVSPPNLFPVSNKYLHMIWIPFAIPLLTTTTTTNDKVHKEPKYVGLFCKQFFPSDTMDLKKEWTGKICIVSSSTPFRYCYVEFLSFFFFPPKVFSILRTLWGFWLQWQLGRVR